LRNVKIMCLKVAALVMTCLVGATAAVAEEGLADKVNIGGALRMNYAYVDYSDTSEDKGGDFGFELFRINADGEVKDFVISAEYRFYSYMNVIHHGWIGYKFSDESMLQVGVSRVPFGILPYASHNFWFSGAYYVGFEDDYDAGVKFLYNDGPLDVQLAFYKNAELASSSNLDRYSVDLVTGNGYSSEETNQVNARVAYTLGHGDFGSTEFGLSGEYGQMYDSVSTKNGDRWAVAAHAVGNYGNFNVQLEGAAYQYDPKYDAASGLNDDVIQLGAFGASWEAPAKAMFGIVNVAYTIPVEAKMLDSITVYSDNTIIVPDKSEHETGMLNVIGMMFASGPVYTYLDYISAENMTFMGSNLVNGDDDRNGRLNLNIGYYF